MLIRNFRWAGIAIAIFLTSNDNARAESYEILPSQWHLGSSQLRGTSATTGQSIYLRNYFAQVPSNPPTTYRLQIDSVDAPYFFDGSLIFLSSIPSINPGVAISYFNLEPVEGVFLDQQIDITLDLTELGNLTCFFQATSSGGVPIPINLVPGTNHITGTANRFACHNYSDPANTAKDVWFNIRKVFVQGPVPQPSPTPSPAPSPTASPTPVVQYELSLSLKPKIGRPDIEIVEGVSSLRMTPTTFGCGQLNFDSDERTLILKCFNKTTGRTIDGCHFSTSIKSGPKNGGHEHDYNSRPLGQIYTDETLPIPANGLEFTYLAPEVSGDIDLTVSGSGPDGQPIASILQRFDLRRENFVALDISDLVFNVESHPSGIFGTSELNRRMNEAMSKFKMLAMASGIQTIPAMESESASLPFGGLFDINYAKDFPWTPPHCSHRDGRRLDVSLSPSSAYIPSTRDLLIRLFRSALRDAQLSSVNEGDHWHVGY